MNRAVMPPRFGLLLAAALLASGCQSGSPSAEAEGNLVGSSIGGPFELVDTEGKTVRWSDFDGKYRVVYFGYAYCPDICPTDVARIMRGYDKFRQANPARAAQVQPIFITIDPERDTPPVMAEFLSNFPPGMIGLTGTAEQIKAAAEAFKVSYSRGQDGGNGSYLMDHTSATYFMGRNGEPIALLPTDVVDKGEAVAAELEKWTG